MNRIYFALVMVCFSSPGALAEECRFLVKLRPTEYHVNKTSADTEYYLNVVGSIEGITYNRGKDKKELGRDKDSFFGLNLQNFPGLVEIVKESMRSQMLLQAVIRWNGVCQDDPTDERKRADDEFMITVRKPKYLAAIGAISQTQRNALKGQKRSWADITENQ